MRRQLVASARAGETIERSAERLLDEGDFLVRVPQHVEELAAAAHDAATGDPAARAAYERVVRRWRSRVERLGQAPDGRPGAYTMRSATQQMIKDLRRAKGENADRIVDRWVLERARHQARLIARNETVEAYRDAYQQGTQDNPAVKGYRWQLSTRHPKPDPCDLLANQNLHGLGPGGYPADELPDTPHPSCIPPGHLIETDRGSVPIESVWVGMLVRTHTGALRRVLRLSERLWAGDLVIASIGDGRLVSTPEHPVLTAQGWKLAKTLCPGDQVFVRRELGNTGRSIAESDGWIEAHDAPADAAKVSFLGVIDAALPAYAVPAARVDLDGHLLIDDRKVDVVATDCELRGDLESSNDECAHRSGLVSGRQDAGLAATRSADEFGERTTRAAHRRVGRFGHLEPTLGRSATARDELLLARRALDDAGAAQSIVDDGPAHAQPHGSLEHAQPAPNIEPNNIVRVDGGAVDAGSAAVACALSGQFTLALVTAVEREPYAGPVHNFAVEEDESYCVDNIVTHNCLCTQVAIVDRFHTRRELAIARGDAEPPREWEVGGHETGAEWLARQPAGYREELLGPTRAAIFAREPGRVLTSRGEPIPVHRVLGLPPPVRRLGRAAPAASLVRADRLRMVRPFPPAPQLEDE